MLVDERIRAESSKHRYLVCSSHSHSDSLESLKSAKRFAALNSKHRRRPLGRQFACLELKHLYLSVVCVP
ncbi:hypothetical protein MHYP_G00083830 [Metynnis hypsauchen]